MKPLITGLSYLLKEILTDLGQMIDSQLNRRIGIAGFVLVLFDSDNPRHANCVSNAKDIEKAIESLKEAIDQLSIRDCKP